MDPLSRLLLPRRALLAGGSRGPGAPRAPPGGPGPARRGPAGARGRLLAAVGDRDGPLPGCLGRAAAGFRPGARRCGATGALWPAAAARRRRLPRKLGGRGRDVALRRAGMGRPHRQPGRPEADPATQGARLSPDADPGRRARIWAAPISAPPRARGSAASRRSGACRRARRGRSRCGPRRATAPRRISAARTGSASMAATRPAAACRNAARCALSAMARRRSAACGGSGGSPAGPTKPAT